MKRHIIVITFLFCALALTGCMSRDQADAMLVKGCAAGINALLPEGTHIDSVASAQFSPSPEGPGLRHVSLTAKTMDGWLEIEKQYECVFDESFGFMNMSYSASIYQLRFDDRVVGKAGNEILGSSEDFLKLTDAVRAALYE